MGLGVIDGRGLNWFPKFLRAVTAELIDRKDFRTALRTGEDESGRTLPAELLVIRVIRLALRAFHPGASRMEERWEWLGVLVLGSVLNSRKSR